MEDFRSYGIRNRIAVYTFQSNGSFVRTSCPGLYIIRNLVSVMYLRVRAFQRRKECHL